MTYEEAQRLVKEYEDDRERSRTGKCKLSVREWQDRTDLLVKLSAHKVEHFDALVAALERLLSTLHRHKNGDSQLFIDLVLSSSDALDTLAEAKEIDV